jgi:hypothetical protein
MQTLSYQEVTTSSSIHKIENNSLLLPSTLL